MKKNKFKIYHPSKKEQGHDGIKYSNTFTKRTICKWCHCAPQEYSLIRNPLIYKNYKFTLNQFSYIRENVVRMASDIYLDFDPKDFKNTAEYKFPVSFKGYNPRLHRTRGSTSRTNVTEILSCPCGRSEWAFNYKSTVERKDIIMRQGSKRY